MSDHEFFLGCIRDDNDDDWPASEKDRAEARFHLDAGGDRVLASAVIEAVAKQIVDPATVAPDRLADTLMLARGCVSMTLQHVVRNSRAGVRVYGSDPDVAQEWFPVRRPDGQIELVRYTVLTAAEWTACAVAAVGGQGRAYTTDGKTLH